MSSRTFKSLNWNLKSILLIFRVRTTLLIEEATLFTNLTTSSSSKTSVLGHSTFSFKTGVCLLYLTHEFWIANALKVCLQHVYN